MWTCANSCVDATVNKEVNIMIKIEINTGNAAFEYTGYETARILRDIAGRIEDDGIGTSCEYTQMILDANGNRCGSITVVN